MTGSTSIYFIPEAGPAKGLGHLYRCIAVADMISHGFHVSFVTAIAEDLKFISDAVGERYACIQLDDIQNQSVIVLDGYGFDLDFQSALKKQFPDSKLVLIDDYIQSYTNVDAIINHSPEIKGDFYLNGPSVRQLLGIEYAMLRKRFLDAARTQREEEHSSPEMVVAFGGSDPNNYSENMARMCLDVPEISRVHVILGGAYTHSWSLENDKLTVHRKLSQEQIIEIYQSCSHGIIPSSTMLFEAIAMGLTILSGAYVENQMSIYRGFLDLGAIVDAGNFEQLDVESIRDFILHSEVNKGAIDGYSDERIYKFFKSLAA